MNEETKPLTAAELEEMLAYCDFREFPCRAHMDLPRVIRYAMEMQQKLEGMRQRFCKCGPHQLESRENLCTACTLADQPKVKQP